MFFLKKYYLGNFVCFFLRLPLICSAAPARSPTSSRPRCDMFRPQCGSPSPRLATRTAISQTKFEFKSINSFFKKIPRRWAWGSRTRWTPRGGRGRRIASKRRTSGTASGGALKNQEKIFIKSICGEVPLAFTEKTLGCRSFFHAEGGRTKAAELEGFFPS